VETHVQHEDGALPNPWSLKRSVPGEVHVDVDVNLEDRETQNVRIRCPLCFWQPTAQSRWRCACINTPEPFFDACGAVWNTFTTRGRCPGCQHQWKWTNCVRCGGASLHEDWYEQDDGGRQP
jgi:hypothetical protein